MPGQPIMSITMTPGSRWYRGQANFEPGLNYIRIQKFTYLTAMEVWKQYDAGIISNHVFCELWSDAEQMGEADKYPLWSFPIIWTDPGAAQAVSTFRQFYQPLTTAQLDIQFRRDNMFPAGTVMTSAEMGTFVVIVEGYPDSLAGFVE